MAAGRQWRERGSAVLELPRTPRLVCVEYPGLVRDVGAMLRTLGGEQGVSRVRRGSPGGAGGGGYPGGEPSPGPEEGAGGVRGARAGAEESPRCGTPSFGPSTSPRRLHAWFRGKAARLGRGCPRERRREVSGRVGAAARPPDPVWVEREFISLRRREGKRLVRV